MVRTAAVFLLFFSLFPGRSAMGDGGASLREGKALRRLIPAKATWSLTVLAQSSGREVAVFGNATGARLIPGSLVKLFTTGAVFDYMEKHGTAGLGRTAMAKRKKRQEIPSSPQVKRRLREMNVHSLNRVAEDFSLLLGERNFGPPATREKGNRVVSEFLRSLNLPTDEATIVDGSGLSPDNRVTTRFIARYLLAVSRKPWFAEFRETLPRAGMEGTVEHIGYTDRRFRVKTGRVEKAFALAGYGIDSHGERLVFAYMVNVPAGAVDRRHSRGAVVRLLARGRLSKTTSNDQN